VFLVSETPRDTDGCPILNHGGAPEATFFVAVANKAERSYTLGIDMGGPYAGASFVSTDGGLTFAPLSSMPIIDGNAMIRAHEKPPGPCFIGAAAANAQEEEKNRRAVS